MVSMAKRYVARGDKNIAAVRHVVTALGAGSKVDVNLGNDRFRGTIQSIQPDSFTVIRGSSTPDRITYQDVREIKSASMRGSTKALIIAGAAVGAMVLAYAASLSCGC